jgi:chromosome segregation ATPase
MVPMHRRAEKIRDENIQLRQELEEAQNEQGQLEYVLELHGKEITYLTDKLKKAEGHINIYTEALDKCGYEIREEMDGWVLSCVQCGFPKDEGHEIGCKHNTK